MSIERLFVKSSFTPQLRGGNLVPPAVKGWGEASDAEVAEYLQKHYAGEINLHEHWNIGDTRTVHLSAMPATGVGESHVEQDVEFQIVNAGGKELADGTECAFIVQLKGVLTGTNGNHEGGYMNSTGSNVGGWKNCARRVWCNNIFRAALPEATRNFFKLHKNKTSRGNSLTTLDETEDYFALPCSYNIFGDGVTSWSGGADEDPVQWAYYDTQEKRKKYPQSFWWMRSPYRDIDYNFCIVKYDGTLNYVGANNGGLAPFGTI